MIPNVHYYDAALLGQELAHVFATGWQFIAMADELANNRDFVCVNLPNDSIVVQNFRGELRAFKNVCTHRLNLIQTMDRGNRHLMCAYHGWVFDAQGMPLGKSGFAPEDADRDRLCLTRYKVDRCGKFVFVSRDPKGPSLEAFLGEFAPLLRDLSRHIGRETHYGLVPHAANWKLLVENVLECYHCATVHPETFVTGLGVGRKPIADVQIVSPHSSSHFPRVPTRRESLRKKIVSHLDSREFAHDSFFHVHIFPNLFISSTEGTAFYVGHALPYSAVGTTLRVRLFEPDVALTEAGRLRQDAINKQGTALALQVIEEDRTILETVQRGVIAADRPSVLGAEEVRIHAFHHAYGQALAGKAVVSAPLNEVLPAEVA
ncbi:aromatic ring-hydroxylating oxygenase subunit alpha [Sphingomonas sp. Ag1]|uniref:aromatic ring-hydroxylating oxygenase subunit alpha n=1 Tax=Sphingomonas sp. Ag1 TaxID=1642949 RepID=UPI000695AD51|nr:aromatic ring-hydroxylating dioxygenase subunit alpha [Sphingomonas sp. Ag1]